MNLLKPIRHTEFSIAEPGTDPAPRWPSPPSPHPECSHELTRALEDWALSRGVLYPRARDAVAAAWGEFDDSRALGYTYILTGNPVLWYKLLAATGENLGFVCNTINPELQGAALQRCQRLQIQLPEDQP